MTRAMDNNWLDQRMTLAKARNVFYPEISHQAVDDLTHEIEEQDRIEQERFGNNLQIKEKLKADIRRISIDSNALDSARLKLSLAFRRQQENCVVDLTSEEKAALDASATEMKLRGQLLWLEREETTSPVRSFDKNEHRFNQANFRGLEKALQNGAATAYGRSKGEHALRAISPGEWKGEWEFFEEQSYARRIGESFLEVIIDYVLPANQTPPNATGGADKRGPYKKSTSWKTTIDPWVSAIKSNEILMPTALDLAWISWRDFNKLEYRDKRGHRQRRDGYRERGAFEDELRTRYPKIHAEITKRSEQTIVNRLKKNQKII